MSKAGGNPMWSIKKILVPTDFSKASEAALEAAVELAKKFDASIVLMHAYHVPQYPYPVPSLITPVDLMEQIEKGARNALQDAVSSQSASGVLITTSLHAGSPWEQILRTAKEFDVGLIVIGSRGLRGLPRALMGSTAERVVRYSPVPVVTLHGPPPTEAGRKARSEGANAADGLTDRWLT
jgi:nucleotide-binding universal stress UspA family protein